MSAIYGLLAISITIAIVFFVIFVLSVKKGQYDDAYTPSVRMLFDDEIVKEKKNTDENSEKNQKTSQSNHKHKQV
ncbi:MAG: cbb3-type cytochrome oxidase assembly protein CcoS [Psychroflexus halocasei]